jgi:hypothetical protein
MTPGTHVGPLPHVSSYLCNNKCACGGDGGGGGGGGGGGEGAAHTNADYCYSCDGASVCWPTCQVKKKATGSHVRYEKRRNRETARICRPIAVGSKRVGGEVCPHRVRRICPRHVRLIVQPPLPHLPQLAWLATTSSLQNQRVPVAPVTIETSVGRPFHWSVQRKRSLSEIVLVIHRHHSVVFLVKRNFKPRDSVRILRFVRFACDSCDLSTRIVAHDS